MIQHSDPGGQSTSLLCGARGQQVGIRGALGSVGDGAAHALAARFLATRDCDLRPPEPVRTPRAARTALFADSAGGSPRPRRPSALSSRSPDA